MIFLYKIYSIKNISYKKRTSGQTVFNLYKSITYVADN